MARSAPSRPPGFRVSRFFCGEIAADHVQHHVRPRPRALATATKSSVAESMAQSAPRALGRLRPWPRRGWWRSPWLPAALASAMAVVPMPLVAAVHQQVSRLAFSPPQFEHVGEHGEHRLRQGGGLDRRRNPSGIGGKDVAGVDDAVLRIAAAAEQGADPVADPPALGALAGTAAISPETSRPRVERRAGRRRIEAVSRCMMSGRTTPAAMTRDQDLARFGACGVAARSTGQGLGRTLAADDGDRRSCAREWP